MNQAAQQLAGSMYVSLTVLVRGVIDVTGTCPVVRNAPTIHDMSSVQLLTFRPLRLGDRINHQRCKASFNKQQQWLAYREDSQWRHLPNRFWPEEKGRTLIAMSAAQPAGDTDCASMQSSNASQGLFGNLTKQKRGSEDYGERRASQTEMMGSGGGVVGGWFNSTFRGISKPADKPENDQKK